MRLRVGQRLSRLDSFEVCGGFIGLPCGGEPFDRLERCFDIAIQPATADKPNVLRFDAARGINLRGVTFRC